LPSIKSVSINKLSSQSTKTGLDPQKYLIIDPSLFRPADVELLQADYSKAKEKLGFEPKVKFKELVKLMVEHDLQISGS